MASGTARLCAALAAVGLMGCVGAVDRKDDVASEGGSGGDHRGGASGTTNGGAGGEANSPGPLVVRRLTRDEFDNTVADLLGTALTPGREFPTDSRGTHGFFEATPVADVVVRRLLDASADLAQAATSKLGALASCDAQKEGEAACLKSFVVAFGKRAFRRPLNGAEVEEFAGLAQSVGQKHGLTYDEKLALLVRAFLQSPEFLYRGPMPMGSTQAKEGRMALNAYEVASRLSYFLWRSMPDEALFDAADSGALLKREEVARQARRMLDDDRALQAVDQFHREWLRLEKLPNLGKDTDHYPNFNEDVRGSMIAEQAAFLKAWFRSDAAFDTLLLAPWTVGDQRVGAIYGAKGAQVMQKLDLPSGQRSGILTQTAFLATHADSGGSKPVARGLVIYEGFLCEHVPPPAIDVPEPKPPVPGLTTRERFSEHADSACARACHELMDPLGFAFEHYDGIGAYRATESDKPVDASGVAIFPTEGDKPFKNAVDLMQTMAGSEDARKCLTAQWMRFALRRHELDGEMGSLLAAKSAAEGDTFNVRDLMVAITTSEAFLHRQIAPGEELPCPCSTARASTVQRRSRFPVAPSYEGLA